MKLKLLIAALLTAAVSTAIADTYIVASDNGTSNDTPKLAAAHAAGGACVYGDKTLKLGDTIIVNGADSVLVCASAPQGAVFYPLSASGAQRVVPAMSAAKSGGETITSTYKITAAQAPAFTPVKAWDDGQFTFIELAKPYHGELPVLFALAEDGSRELVNFQWDKQNSRFVIQRLLDRAVLIQGDKSVVVSRI